MFEVKYKVNNGFIRDKICYAVIKDNEERTLFRYWDDEEDDWLACCDARLYTGLKDKNGKEIYEGDLLYHKIQGLRKVYYPFDKRSASFGLLEVNNGMRSYLENSFLYEVVGNIYENPELLKGE